jgi:hypothetical protein
MKTHPYSKLPASSYWRQAVANVPPGDVDPMVDPPFRLGARDKIVTAGSCFAQHIGRHLAKSGCNYLVTEKPHPFLTERVAQALNYGVYSARYGNVYTSRQLLQLFDRAYGRFLPKENYWREGAGVVIDPFRPQIQEGGFNSVRELDLDRERHFAAAREAFETLDVFVFTLGLTEAWRAREDGAVFPLCPGVAGGDYAPEAHAFINFSVDEVVADMTGFFERLWSVNAGARVILTVSPVPLVATAERRHVMVSTMASKSILRVACDTLERRFDNVAYFPSYEIVAGGYCGVDYFGPDRRSVTPEGVAHVMRVFDRRFIKRGLMEEALRRTAKAFAPSASATTDAVADAMKLLCDEEALELGPIHPERTSTGTPDSSGNPDDEDAEEQ